jgi:hypothetical protein
MRKNRTTGSLLGDPALARRPLWLENKGNSFRGRKTTFFSRKPGRSLHGCCRSVTGEHPEFGILPSMSQESGTCSYSSVPVASRVPYS